MISKIIIVKLQDQRRKHLWETKTKLEIPYILWQGNSKVASKIMSGSSKLSESSGRPCVKYVGTE